jgi:hypothetical protein
MFDPERTIEVRTGLGRRWGKNVCFLARSRRPLSTQS